ncbi:RimJ/RimL family protein N-acetyltransferase [Nocardia sp. GAS34]|uniref:GNAT family N-acetyltransferase n=1 Tax=unclassified Nocardia TaxID=2637762 RepID=UPI003D20B22A
MDTERPQALAPGVAPPERIELDGLVIRRWLLSDAEAQLQAIEASYDELHSWLSWLAEPLTVEKQQEYFRMNVADWPVNGNCNYGVFDSGGTLLASLGLHDQVGRRTLEIGYWCHTEHTGRGVITRAAGAVTEIGLSLPGIDHIEIHCDVTNERSAAVPRRLGYRLDRIQERAPRAPAESGREMIWVRDR